MKSGQNEGRRHDESLPTGNDQPQVARQSAGSAMERISGTYLQSLVENISMPIIVIGTDMRVKFINPAAEIIFGEKARENPVGTFCYSFMFDHESSCAELGKNCPLAECRETSGTVKTEFRLDADEDFPRYYEIIATPLYNNDGMVIGIVEMFNDITDWKLFEKWLKAAQQDSEHQLRDRTAKLLETNKSLRREVQERQRTEKALLQARKRSELLYHVIPSAIFTVDLEKNITSWNDKAEALTGYMRDEIVGKPCNTFALYPCTDKCGMYSDSIVKPIVGRECIIRTKSGESRIISKNGDFIVDDDGNVTGAVESFEDITNIKKYEEQLRSERDKLQGMLSSMGQGMHILSPDYSIEYQNEDARDAFGDCRAARCFTVYREMNVPCENCLMHAAIETETVQRTEILLSNGKCFAQSYTPFMDVDGQTKVLVLLRDITEEKLLQAETMRAVQLASVGELAAGVAHEINNPVNGIINYAQIIQDEAGDNETMAKISQKIIREGERVATIVSNLLSFARQQDEESEKINLSDAVYDAIDLIRHQLSKNCILLEVFLPADLPLIFGHHQQLQQVFLNLFNNARFALNQRYAGKDPQKKIIIDGMVVAKEDGNYVRIIVKDLGTGISEDKVQKIFEPFFSTKTTGEGTGLGLSISREIIAKHRGHLQVDTVCGQYTSMIVDIPVDNDDAEGGATNLNPQGTEHD